jgi:protein gp37
VAEADRRMPAITSIPAVVRFLSVEPLFERVTLDLRGIG